MLIEDSIYRVFFGGVDGVCIIDSYLTLFKLFKNSMFLMH